jgi:hypothetical protein
MELIKGNIWEYKNDNNYVVIPTNIGWKKDGKNVMGAGLAKQALAKFPDIDSIYGNYCRYYYDRYRYIDVPPYWYENYKLIFMASKPLDLSAPYRSWLQDSSVQQIEISCNQLIQQMEERKFPEIIMPIMGVGNGKLKQENVLPLLIDKFEKYDNIKIVDINLEE